MSETQVGAIALAALLVGAVVGAGAAMVVLPAETDQPLTQRHDDPTPENDSQPRQQSTAGVAQFEDADAFRAYVRQGQDSGGYVSFDTGAVAVDTVELTRQEASLDVSEPASGGDGGASERHSGTNVQVAGIDEPDILKTTGDHLYYASRPSVVVAEPVREGEERVRKRQRGQTHVFDTGTPAAPEAIAGINASGDLLLAGDTLVVFEGSRLTGYDVRDPARPEQVWSRTIDASVETARLANGTLYLVTRSGVSPATPCPVEPLGGPGAAIRCTDIYHPRGQVDVDVTYSAFALDPASGDVREKVSFVGTRERSAVYMSGSALYVTYTERTDRGEITLDAVLSESVSVPDWVADRLREVRSYNLSARATGIEVRATLQQWYSGLDPETAAETRERVREGIESYVADHRREFVRTGVVRVDTAAGLSVESVGEVPGEPLNQFSMDEHNGTLRIATTVPRQFGTDSVNDLYTLDAQSLERRGAVQGMGVDERVYAVRYVGETAYVVTFRQIDPFHVVDLSDPENPEEVGELKLPGYSSYLHPVDENHVLGIGEEDGRVKTVLFDVSDPANPTIDDTYFPEARWSAISQSHHAFLMDRKHGVFFLPGDDSGYVVDYTNGTLAPEKQVPLSGQATRAAYIDDYLYVFSDREMVVVDETDWTVETERVLG